MWLCTPLHALFARPLQPRNENYTNFAQGVSETGENADFTHPVQSVQMGFARLQGRPKTAEERNVVRDAFERCGGSYRATMRAVWGVVGGNYSSYINECLEVNQ